MKRKYDLLILGSGFAGSLLALIAAKLGKSVALLEPGKHPRFAIGESSTPLANLLLEELCEKYSLTNLRPLCKWGTWQQYHPEISGGLKRGFTFFHHGTKGAMERFLVEASPNNMVADTHWYREEFDFFILKEAIHAGVAYFDNVKISEVDAGTVVANEQVFAGDFIIDASGPRGILHRALNLEENKFSTMPETKAVFSHFVNVSQSKAATSIYPVDDAAVHHLFEDGWVWVLRFNNGITSAGAAMKKNFAIDCASPEKLWETVLERMPELRDQFRNATATQPFRYFPQLAFRSSRAAGERWLLLPSAAGFVDPLLSTGFPLTLMGIKRIADWLEKGMPDSFLAEYEKITLAELEYAAELISALYANFDNFDRFKALTLLYFGAASFSETALRLGKKELVGDRFLLSGLPVFERKVRSICEAARMNTPYLYDQVNKAIEPFDAAGLCGETLRQEYPVNFCDLFNNAHKLRATKSEIEAMLSRLGSLS